MSGKKIQVLNYFLNDSRRRVSGAEIARDLEIKSGTLYPLLATLEREGILESEWEEVVPSEVGRPRRRLYRFTPHGQQFAFSEVSRFLGVKNSEKGFALFGRLAE